MNMPQGPVAHPSVTVQFGHASDMAKSQLGADLPGGPDTGKQVKSEVGYRVSINPKERCEVCISFEGEAGESQASCAKVSGTVQAADTCDLFADAEPGDDPTAPPPAKPDEAPPGPSGGSPPPWMKE